MLGDMGMEMVPAISFVPAGFCQWPNPSRTCSEMSKQLSHPICFTRFSSCYFYAVSCGTICCVVSLRVGILCYGPPIFPRAKPTDFFKSQVKVPLIISTYKIWPLWFSKPNIMVIRLALSGSPVWGPVSLSSLYLWHPFQLWIIPRDCLGTMSLPFLCSSIWPLFYT